MLTTDNIIIMGRKTFDSIGKALPNRINIVITSDQQLCDMEHSQDLYFVNSIDQALIKCAKVDPLADKVVYVIGGGQIYEQFLSEKYIDIVDECYITHVYNEDQEASDETVYFPTIKNSVWKLVDESEIHPSNEKDQYEWKICRYHKK